MALTNAQRAAAVAVMEDATSSFVQDPYASEALTALEDAGWTLVPPGEAALIDPSIAGWRQAGL